MFSLFSSKPSKQESVDYISKIANEARIEVAMVEGNYGGFLIFIDEDGASLGVHFKHPEVPAKFIKIIETRISSGQYDDPQAEMEDMFPGWGAVNGRKANLNVVRGVFGRENKSLFQWNPPNKS
jgi:hypothetical protein